MPASRGRCQSGRRHRCSCTRPSPYTSEPRSRGWQAWTGYWKVAPSGWHTSPRRRAKRCGSGRARLLGYRRRIGRRDGHRPEPVARLGVEDLRAV